ncbi:MAG TPA: protein kinase [Pyrinomonadaceae bacterium]|jgi:serine/threonine-protein kinase
MKLCPVCKSKYEDSVSFCPVDGEVLDDDPTTIVDSVLDGQYHIEALLGRGGMGAVYRARHILLGDRVAIKVLPPQMRNNAEWLRRFRREGQAARRFRHPNAVTVYDLRTTSEGLIYMVMEYVEGHTLDVELKRRGRFTPAEAFAVLEPVMSVLNAAHAMGVVHRDLKPENIMIGKPNEQGQSVTKLLDLGIAKISEVAGTETGGSTALTVAGQVLGTPFYMSPEQWGEVSDDGNTEIDGRADIYSLGVVFYELVMGRRPFIGLTLQELRREHVSVTPRPLDEVQSEVPRAFSQAIARAMSKDRGQRQATAGELAGELRAALGLPAMSSSMPGFEMSSGTHSGGMSSPTSVNAVVEGRAAQTSAPQMPEAPGEGADVLTPTILTVDSPPRPQADAPSPLAPTSLAQQMPPPYQPQQPAPSYNAGHATAPPLPTVATNSAGFSHGGQAQPFSHAPAQTPRRSSSTPLILAVLAVLLLGGGAGAWFLLRNRGDQPAVAENKPGTAEEANKKATAPEAGTTVAGTREAVNYWLELEGAKGQESERGVGNVPLASGQAFKFHFTPNENGYLYIVGPGEGNVPTTFLTDKPLEDYGETNAVESGVDFSFPEGEDGWIELDKKAGTEVYTVIFSPTRISTPAFLKAGAGRDLTAAEQKELEDFKARYKANAPASDVINANGDEPLVSVRVPQAAAAGEPVIFDIRLEHK